MTEHLKPWQARCYCAWVSARTSAPHAHRPDLDCPTGPVAPSASVPPTPPAPAPGMTSEQLAEYVDGFTRAAVGRVIGVGHDQYAEADGQRFERMPLDELLAWTLEELQDVAVYAAMLGVRVQWLREQYAGHEGEARTEYAVRWDGAPEGMDPMDPCETQGGAYHLAARFPEWSPAVVRRAVTVGPWEVDA